jgi:SAM-dependent methyltransferase
MSTDGHRRWKAIWDRRRVTPAEGDLLAALIVADGCDTGFGSYPTADWTAMVADVAHLAGVSEPSRVLEIGCGAGAFLYELHRQTGCRVSGLDYSASLIEEARRHLPFGDFTCLEAVGLAGLPGGFDAIFSHSVFFYFPDHTYVSRVLAAAFDQLAPGGVLCLQDLNDLARQPDYETHRRRTYRRPGDYDRDYAGLSHLFFDRQDTIEELRGLGFEPVRLFDHTAKGYANAAFRFNLLARKPGGSGAVLP